MGRNWSLLSITDLHYEDPDANYIDDNKELKWPQFRDEIFQNFNRLILSGFGSPAFPTPLKFDLIAVCGDITTQGKVAGFDRFAHEAFPALSQLVRETRAICVVPGNHDVVWGIDPTKPDSLNQKFAPFLNMIEEIGVTSCLYPVRQVSEQQNRLELQRPLNGPLFVDENKKLIVLCINSSIRCVELNSDMQTKIENPIRDAIGKLKADEPARELLTNLVKNVLPKYLVRDVAQVILDQTQRLIATLEKERKRLKDKREDWASYLRVAVLHHHLIHFPEQVTEHKGYELLLDSSQVLKMLADFDFDLVLTGHKHQPYEVPYAVGQKQLLLVGGPTVGGYAAGSSFKGLRWIDVEEVGHKRIFKISDLEQEFGKGSPSESVEAAKKKAIKISSSRSLKAAHDRRVGTTHFSYRALASITLLQDDGIARRIVDCDDLSVTSDCPQRWGQQLHLPRTSGYLADFKAKGKSFHISVENNIENPKDKRVHEWSPKLVFNQSILDSAVSYTYQWKAVSAFPMNKGQFRVMHRDSKERLDNIEFTHFMAQDPVEELTVIVQFPPGFKLDNPPSLRIAYVDSATDARKWTPDKDTKHELESQHALRYYDSLKIAAMRVRYPRPELSYGIQWEVPSIDSDPAVSSRNQRLVARLNTKPTESQRQSTLQMLEMILNAARNSFLKDWSRPIHASLMYFDLDYRLPLIGAAVQSRIVSEYTTREVSYKDVLEYGDGIAGRAFMCNRMRVYVYDPNDVEEIDLYTLLPGGPRHKAMVSWPVNLPVSKDIFVGNARIYESIPPYGVISIGSEDSDCPLGDLRLPEFLGRALSFQHDLNSLVYQQLNEIY